MPSPVPSQLVKLEDAECVAAAVTTSAVHRPEPVRSGDDVAAAGNAQPIQGNSHSSGFAHSGLGHNSHEDDDEDEDLIDEDELEDDDEVGEQDSSLTSCSNRALAFALSRAPGGMPDVEDDDDEDEDLVDEDEDEELPPRPAPTWTNGSTATNGPSYSAVTPSFLTVEMPSPREVDLYSRQVRSLQELYNCTDLPTMEESYRCVNDLGCRSGVTARGPRPGFPVGPDDAAIKLTSQADIAVPYLLRKTIRILLMEPPPGGCGLKEDYAVSIVRELTDSVQGWGPVVHSCIDGVNVTEGIMQTVLARVRHAASAAEGGQNQLPTMSEKQVRGIVYILNKWGSENRGKVRAVNEAIMGTE